MDAFADAPLFSRQDGLAVQEPERSWEFAPSVESSGPYGRESSLSCKTVFFKFVIQCPADLQMVLVSSQVHEPCQWFASNGCPGAASLQCGCSSMNTTGFDGLFAKVGAVHRVLMSHDSRPTWCGAHHVGPVFRGARARVSGPRAMQSRSTYLETPRDRAVVQESGVAPGPVCLPVDRLLHHGGAPGRRRRRNS